MEFLENVSLAIGIIGIAIVVWGVIMGFLELFQAEIYRLRSGGRTPVSLEKIRHGIGRYLLLGLEFLVAADIIRTIIQPTLEDVAILAAIVGIRTVISYFLTHEIRERRDRE